MVNFLFFTELNFLWAVNTLTFTRCFSLTLTNDFLKAIQYSPYVFIKYSMYTADNVVIDSCLRNQQLMKGQPDNFYTQSSNNNINDNID